MQMIRFLFLRVLEPVLLFPWSCHLSPKRKETFKHQTRKLINDLPSAMPTKQGTHLLGNLESIIDGVMIDFEDVWQDVTLVDHPSVAPSLSPSVSPSES